MISRFISLRLLLVVFLIGCGESKQSASSNSSLNARETKESASNNDLSTSGFDGGSRAIVERHTEIDAEVQWELEIKDVFNGTITNGVSYEKATLEPIKGRILFVPHDALLETRNNSEDKNTIIYLAKTFSFFGHGGPPRHIRKERECVGIATRDNGYHFFIGTFGEWDSHIEGGLFTKMLVSVPRGIEVEKLERLSGEESNAMYEDMAQRFADRVEKGNTDYCPRWRKPAQGWTVIETHPDHERRCPSNRSEAPSK